MVISPQQLTIYLYSAHRAVIFAIAQLSCSCCRNGGRGARNSHPKSTRKVYSLKILSSCTHGYYYADIGNHVFVCFLDFSKDFDSHSVHCLPGSPRHPAHITLSQSPPSLSSPITAPTFHSRLKTHLFHKSFPP